jgi:hypothetical protein
MSELAIPIMGLTMLAGYIFNKDGKASRKEEQKTVMEHYEKPNGPNIYQSDKVNEINRDLLEKSQVMYEKSRTPALTGVLPPLFNTYGASGKGLLHEDIGNGDVIKKASRDNRLSDPLRARNIDIDDRPMFTTPLARRDNTDLTNTTFRGNEDLETNLLTGLPMERNHKNMVPFFGSKIKQNIETFSNESLLDSMTGNVSTYKPKKEVTRFFDPKEENIYGAPLFTNEIDMDRYIPSVFKQNERIIPDVKVAAPIAGTVDNSIRPVFKTVDDLRVLSKQKESYKSRIIEGQRGEVRGVQVEVSKQRPETFYEKGQDHLFTTTGYVIGDKAKENFQNFKDTSRQSYNIEYFGGVNSENPKDRQRVRHIDSYDNSAELDMSAIMQAPKRINHDNDYMRNVGSNGMQKNTNDYGKDSMSAYETERQTSGLESHILNRTKGEFGMKPRLADGAKDTLKQTTLYNDNSGNVKTSFNSSFSAAFNNGVAGISVKPTHKQSAILNNYVGNMNKSDGMGYLVNVYQPRETHKQDTLVRDRLSGPQSFQVAKGKDSVGELKHTANMFIKEREDDREKLNVHTQQQIPDKNLIGYVQNFRNDVDDEDLINDNRMKPDLVQYQHDLNPYSIYNKNRN